MKWLEKYLEYTEDQESPSIFHLWVGLSLISAVLGRRVWIDRGYYFLFPNLYVVLVAGSARARKSTALGIGVGLLKKAGVDVNIISQKITPEAFIKA